MAVQLVAKASVVERAAHSVVTPPVPPAAVHARHGHPLLRDAKGVHAQALQGWELLFQLRHYGQLLAGPPLLRQGLVGDGAARRLVERRRLPRRSRDGRLGLSALHHLLPCDRQHGERVGKAPRLCGKSIERARAGGLTLLCRPLLLVA